MNYSRFMTKVMACTVTASMLAGVVFADDWYLENGDITIDTSSEQQVVSQGANSAQDSAPVISNSSTGGIPYMPTDNTITVTGGGEANLTIENVKIESSNSGIDVQGNTTANITVSGQNEISQDYNGYDKSAIHVTDGTLNLNSDVTDSLEVNSGYFGAGIGGNMGEDFKGNVNVSGHGNVTINGTGSGAGIGGGDGGAMANGSSVVIDGKVAVGSAGGGAAIGGGSKGDMAGSIHLTENSTTDITRVEGSDALGLGYGGKVQDGAVISADKGAQVKNQGGQMTTIESSEDLKGFVSDAAKDIVTDRKPVEPVEPVAPVVPAVQEVKSEPVGVTRNIRNLFRIDNGNGQSVWADAVAADGVLTVTYDGDQAVFVTSVSGLRQLMNRHFQSVVFVVGGHSCTLPLAEAAEGQPIDAEVRLTVSADAATLSVGDTDLSSLLK